MEEKEEEKKVEEKVEEKDGPVTCLRVAGDSFGEDAVVVFMWSTQIHPRCFFFFRT